jgi:hypothetical protein
MTSRYFELHDLKTADNPEQSFESKLQNFETMLDEYRKII